MAEWPTTCAVCRVALRLSVICGINNAGCWLHADPRSALCVNNKLFNPIWAHYLSSGWTNGIVACDPDSTAEILVALSSIPLPLRECLMAWQGAVWQQQERMSLLFTSSLHLREILLWSSEHDTKPVKSRLLNSKGWKSKSSLGLLLSKLSSSDSQLNSLVRVVFPYEEISSERHIGCGTWSSLLPSTYQSCHLSC